MRFQLSVPTNVRSMSSNVRTPAHTNSSVFSVSSSCRCGIDDRKKFSVDIAMTETITTRKAVAERLERGSIRTSASWPRMPLFRCVKAVPESLDGRGSGSGISLFPGLLEEFGV
eukprot:4951026-Prymnesium_polylepis.1